MMRRTTTIPKSAGKAEEFSVWQLSVSSLPLVVILSQRQSVEVIVSGRRDRGTYKHAIPDRSMSERGRRVPCRSWSWLPSYKHGALRTRINALETLDASHRVDGALYRGYAAWTFPSALITKLASLEVYRRHEGPVANGDQSSERPDRTETLPAIFKKESESKRNDEEYEFPA